MSVPFPRRTNNRTVLVCFLSIAALCIFFTFGSQHVVHGSVGKYQLATLSELKQDRPNSDGAVEERPALVDDNESVDENNDDDANDDGISNDGDEDGDDLILQVPDRGDYRELYSLTTTDRKFFPIYFGDSKQGYNPNIIPHPTKHDMWIVVAQHEQSRETFDVSGELVCTAGFFEGVLICADPPTILPITPSITGVCEGDLAYMNFRFGPRDARMFYGPSGPLILYGTQSQYACLGIWVQDVRMILDAFHLERFALAKLFISATEIQRPLPWHGIEKNFFVFWDVEGKAYVHHDIHPKRVFAELDFDGSVGEDLAPKSAAHDEACMAQYMPHVGPNLESIHQATNSLAITLCKRADPKCIPDSSNTFVMHIFQYKVHEQRRVSKAAHVWLDAERFLTTSQTYHDYHGIYEPYVVLFQQSAPFAIHAISQRPLWIHGRNALTKATGSLSYEGKPDSDIPNGHTEMFYMTSMSYKSHSQRYHGYIDDVLFLAFGIEDSRSGAIDIMAGDLLQDLALC